MRQEEGTCFSQSEAQDQFLVSSPEDVDAAVAVGEEEHVVIVVPGDLVHLELELLLGFGAVSLGVDEGDDVVFVADGDGLSVRAPADVDVFS